MSKKPAKKSIEVPEHGDEYFIYLKNPAEYRRQLLESSRKTLYGLRNYHRLLLIRQRKHDQMQKLHSSVKELLYLNKKFNEKLPKYDSKFLNGIKTEDDTKPAKVTPIHVKKPVAVQHHEKSELDRLEESLAHIEKKLRNLQ